MSTILFLLSLAILYYVIRYRIHVRFSISIYTEPQRAGLSAHRQRGTGHASSRVVPGVSHGRGRNEGEQVNAPLTPQPIAVMPESVVWGDIASALVNLGAKKHAAEKAARRAVQQHPEGSFDVQFSCALQEVWRAA